MAELLEQTQDLGVDLRILPAADRIKTRFAGDLLADKTGDLELIDGTELVVRGRIRELTTPLGLYARYIEDVDGLKIIDAEYGNTAYHYLSEPSNTIPLDKIILACRDTMLKDIRVQTADVIPSIDPRTGNINITVNFRIISGNTGTLTFGLNTTRF